MKTHTLLLGLLLALAAVPAPAQSQRMAIPSYFAPGPLWAKLGDAAPPVALAVINPNSGPGDAYSAAYAGQVRATKARGITVLGYIHTSYGKRPLGEVQDEAARYYRWYGVSGLFFDEVTNNDAGLPYYARCRRIARAGHPQAVVVVNPGTPVTEGYMRVADIVLTFESDYGAYVKRAADPDWVRRYPARRFWHLVYDAPDGAALQNAVRLSKARNAGWVYVTPAHLPNPWDVLPDQPYWSAELAALNTR